MFLFYLLVVPFRFWSTTALPTISFHKLVSRLGLSIQFFSGLHIRLGNGHRVWVQEKCEYLDVKLGDVSCNLIALFFDLGNLDMVLGMT